MTVNQQQLETFVDNSRARFEDLLGQMVEIPSISMDPARSNDIRRMATMAVQVLTDLGAEAQIVETGGHPVVSGGWTTGTHHPTVTIYNHMDVQPAQEPEWKQEPFAFKKEDGIYRGRGATDDKGPALSAMLGARFAIDQDLPINIRFLWELEEEIGSPHF
ncbi:MAG: M20/M25/M40 family metallo-hydrolase, partial [Nitrospira sp.]